MRIEDILQDYNGKQDLEKVIAEFVAYLSDNDVVLCEVQYETCEFDIVRWAKKTYPEAKINYSHKEPCSDCEQKDYPHMDNDYICMQCRAILELLTYDPIQDNYTGITEDGYDLWLSDDTIVNRVPIDSYYSPGVPHLPSLIYYFIRQQSDRLPPTTERPTVLPPPAPF